MDAIPVRYSRCMTPDKTGKSSRPATPTSAFPLAEMTGDDYQWYEPVDVCPLCTSPERVVVDREAAVVRCRGCGHRYVHPRPTQDEIARAYSLPTAYDEWLQAADAREAMWRRRFHRVLGDVPAGRLLDVGAGIGTFLAIARDQGWAIEGTEVSTTAIAHAQERYAIAVHRGFLEELTPPGPYDAITLWHVIEHVPDPVATLRFCHRILADHGQMILAMPNDGRSAWALTAIGNVVRRALGRRPSPRYERLQPGVESHIQHFNQKTIRRLLSECGFVLDRITVDDAAPQRSRLGSVAFMTRRLLSTATPWNFGREMLVTATRRSEAR
jgi:SAM-dependent methyltransferase